MEKEPGTVTIQILACHHKALDDVSAGHGCDVQERIMIKLRRPDVTAWPAGSGFVRGE